MPEKTLNLILCGLGGQGILFMTRVLALSALRKGADVMGAETHGMAQRGGSVVSHLRVGDTKNSLVNAGAAHFILSLDENEAYRNLAFLARGGRMIVSTSSTRVPRREVRSFLADNGMICRCLPADKVAADRGAPRSANLALIGFMSAFTDCPLDPGDIRATIADISPDRFRQVNLDVYNAGVEWGGQHGAAVPEPETSHP